MAKQQRIQIVVDSAIKNRVRKLSVKNKRSAQQEAAVLLERALEVAEKEAAGVK
jgi:hypothetical protein